MADDSVPLLPVGWLLADPYRTDQVTGDLAAPVLIVHGADDDVIGVSHARDLARQLGDRARLVELGGVSHNDIWRSTAATDAIRAFVETIASDD